MKKVLIYLTEDMDRAMIHEQFKEELSFPDYYGMNLDALYD